MDGHGDGDGDGADAGASTRRATFLHREIFHLKPQKVGRFGDRLVKEYSSLLSRSQSDTQNENDVSNGNNSNGGGRGGNATDREAALGNNTNTRSIIDTVRQMNGCYSFDIYCRAENLLNAEEWETLYQQNTHSCNAASAGELEDAVTREFSLKEAEEKAPARNPREKEEVLCCKHNEASSESTLKNENDRASSEENLSKKEELQNGNLSSAITLQDGKLSSMSHKKPAKEEKNNLPHQYMVMGRWENSHSHQMFFVNRAVQKFFCPLISRKVIESLPILTLWEKENGSHVFIDNSHTDGQTPVPSNHFVMTRKRILKDASAKENALTLASQIACCALEEDGCLVYDICATGHPDFNQNELLEVGIWKRRSDFMKFVSQTLRKDSNYSILYELFDNSCDETSFWERPYPSATS